MTISQPEEAGWLKPDSTFFVGLSSPVNWWISPLAGIAPARCAFAAVDNCFAHQHLALKLNYGRGDPPRQVIVAWGRKKAGGVQIARCGSGSQRKWLTHAVTS